MMAPSFSWGLRSGEIYGHPSFWRTLSFLKPYAARSEDEGNRFSFFFFKPMIQSSNSIKRKKQIFMTVQMSCRVHKSRTKGQGVPVRSIQNRMQATFRSMNFSFSICYVSFHDRGDYSPPQHPDDFSS